MVSSKGHIFIMEILDEFGEILSPLELQSQLQKIKDRSLSEGPAEGIAYLTSEERTKWAQVTNFALCN